MSLALVTDSTVCLPQELVDKYGIVIVPVALILEGRIYRDGIDLTPAEFYSQLKKANRLPTTAPSSPGAYLEAYRQAQRLSQNILCITVSSRVSAMYDSARQGVELAREALPGARIEVVDSGTAAMAQGFLVIKAARLAQEGVGFDETLRQLQELKPRLYLLAMLDTLHYLAKGGRLPAAAAWAGSLLRVKPILQVRQGEISLVERPRTRKKGMERLLALMWERVGGKAVRAAVVHAASAQDAQALKDQVSAQFLCRELYITEFTPVMGTHTGPGLLGLAFYAED